MVFSTRERGIFILALGAMALLVASYLGNKYFQAHNELVEQQQILAKHLRPRDSPSTAATNSPRSGASVWVAA